MAAKKNTWNSVRHLAGAKADGFHIARLLLPSKPPGGITAKGTSGSPKPAASTDLKSQPLRMAGNVTGGIKFGSPSSNRVTTSKGTSEWANLLKQTASGGISSAFGGGLMSAIGGLGGLVSSIAGLFGGSKKTLAPLTLFQLPSSQAHTVFVSSKTGGTASLNTNSGGAAASSNTSLTTGHGQSFQNQSTEIAQAVKQALLNSSSLNDVIAEI